MGRLRLRRRLGLGCQPPRNHPIRPIQDVTSILHARIIGQSVVAHLQVPDTISDDAGATHSRSVHAKTGQAGFRMTGTVPMVAVPMSPNRIIESVHTEFQKFWLPARHPETLYPISQNQIGSPTTVGRQGTNFQLTLSPYFSLSLRATVDWACGIKEPLVVWPPFPFAITD